MKPEVSHPRYEKLEPGTRQRIFDAALKEFGRFGYRSASMNRLVEGAGISKGALFKYFGTKSGLFGYVYSSTLSEVKNVLREVRDKTFGEPFFTRLERIITAGLEFTARRPLSAAVYYRVIYTGDAPHGNHILGEIQDTSKRFLRSLVEDGMAKGELREDLDPERAAFILQSVLDRFLQAHYLEFMAPALDSGAGEGNSGTGRKNDQWVQEIIHIFRNGMRVEK
ncbi:MAG: TetR/AcrR family transcriptional regulator [bacterium]|nr:TetR/AcrR family transcriptional regulator [bacterium]MDT8396741.1 TetR/AcrR family transcriptional regulator [bacterium]